MDHMATLRSIRKWHEDPSLIKAPVVVCAVSGTFFGNTYHFNDQRLLDALNGGFVAKALRLGKDFMPLTDVDGYFPNGKKTTLPFIYVRKASVFFVGEKKRDQREVNAINGASRKAHLVRRKMPREIEVYMPPYILNGNVHVDIWEELLETIDKDMRFLPLTEARVYPALAGGTSAFSFIAVNKDHVVYLSEPAK